MRVHLANAGRREPRGTRAHPDVQQVFSRVRTPEVAEVVAETLAHLEHARLPVEEVAFVADGAAIGVLSAAPRGRPARDAVAVPVPVPGQANAAVYPQQAVPAPAGAESFAVERDEPDVGAGPKVPAHAQHGVAVARQRRRRLRLHGERAGREARRAAGHP